MEEKKKFAEYLQRRISSDLISLFKNPVIQKAYYIGAYASAVIASSYYSKVSDKNTTFKTWLSNQIVTFRNLDRIFATAFHFEQKLKLLIANDSEVRTLAVGVPPEKPKGISNAKITYAFVAGLDDYKSFLRDKKPDKTSDIQNKINNP